MNKNTNSLEQAPLAHTIEAVSRATSFGRTAIYEAIKTGSLKARKCGRRTIILDQDLRQWLAAMPAINGNLAEGD